MVDAHQKEISMSNFVKPTGGCIKCAKSEWVRTAYFCGNKKLTNKQLYNDKGYCSKFVPRTERKTNGENLSEQKC